MIIICEISRRKSWKVAFLHTLFHRHILKENLLKTRLWLIYIGEVCMQKCSQYCNTILPSLLTLAISTISISVTSPKVAKASK
jgi:hypothetical protein